MNNQFIQRVIFDWNRIDNDSYLKGIEAFKGIEKLDFNKPITFFVGENGSGKSLFEELGGKYERQGDYLIPCLTVPAEEEQAIGIWGQRHLDYLKQYRKVTYTNLLTSGRLNAYLADINRQAQERFERLIEGMKQAQGITEQLKAENALEWTGCLNNIRACAREIVEKEIIFA